MKSLLAGKAAKHTVLSIGLGLGAFLADAATITTNPWVQAGCGAGIAFLGSMGVTYAKRSAP